MRYILTFSLLFACTSVVRSQEFGLSFSYFLPRNGYFSAPISPFSVRGLGVEFNRYFAFETGATLYRISGLSLRDLPFEYNKPLTGPNFTAFLPAAVVFMLKGQHVSFDLKAGGFIFYALGQQLQYGNLDRALREWEGWTVLNSSASFKNYPGWGYYGGAELTVPLSASIGISLEVNYLLGQARFPLSGSYTGGITTLETRTFSFDNAKIDFSGLEFSIGVFYASNTRSAPRPRGRR
jgi:hypothetical protein